MKSMYRNPHCFGASCDSHSFGRKRRGGRKARGPRRSPARSLRAPPRGPIFHNLPGPTNQKIIAMGFDLGNGFPDMDGYRKFLMDMRNASFGQGLPFLALGLGFSGNFDFDTNPESFENLTESLYGYTDALNWKLGYPSNDPSYASVYRMQDVAIWWKKDRAFCKKNNMCRNVIGPTGQALAMPWSYVATVQPGGKIRRRTRRGMVNFLRDYVKYTTAQRLGTIGAPPSLQSPIQASTKGLDPFQRKMQRNTFKAKRNRR